MIGLFLSSFITHPRYLVDYARNQLSPFNSAFLCCSDTLDWATGSASGL